MGIFDFDNRFFRFTSKLLNLIILNILWVVFSIPIITVGAATAAVYYVTLKMARDEEGYLFKDFFKGFKQNFRQGTVLEIIFLMSGFVLYGDIRYFLLHESIYNYFFIAIFGAITIVYIFALIFAFPIAARFKNKLLVTLKNAVIMSLKHVTASIMMSILLLLILYGFYVSIPIMILCPIIAMSGYAYIGSILFRNIFDKY